MQFLVKAVDGSRGIVSLQFDAPSSGEARQLAEQQGLRVMSLRPTRAMSMAGLPGLRSQRGQAFPLVLFSQELATLLNAGLALVAAIESLAEKEEEATRRKVLTDITRLLYEGKSFSQALGHMPAVFPELYVALIQSSERTGSVAEALGRYVSYHTRVEMVKQKVISSSVYPALLIVVGTGVLLFLLGYVVPRFSAVFGGKGGANLPWLSQVLLATGQMIHDHIVALSALAGLMVIAAVMLLRLPAVRRGLVQFVGTLPAIQRRLFLYQVSRLYRSLGILLQGGIPIVAAIGMARGLVDESVRARLDRVSQRVREGQPLSQALEQNDLVTPVSLRMVRAGEQAGNLGAMMERTADFYDEEMSRWVDWFVRLFEPLLMVFVGAMIGFVVILMYLPIFELAGSIQ